MRDQNLSPEPTTLLRIKSYSRLCGNLVQENRAKWHLVYANGPARRFPEGHGDCNPFFMATKAKKLKNPRGGLTEAGRKHFARTEGAHLKPGVTGAADTPEKMRRKGSFLRRHFANPRGPMVDAKGKPTRLALSAHAWGERVPKTMTAAKKLALKGKNLLERYARTKKSKTGSRVRRST